MFSLDCFCHYENMPMQCTEIFKVVKNENFKLKNVDSFLIFAQSIHCGYSLEPPRQGGSNEYPQSMFWSKSKKCIPQFCYIIVGFKEVYISWTCFPDGVIVGLIELHWNTFQIGNCFCVIVGMITIILSDLKNCPINTSVIHFRLGTGVY